MVECVYWFTRTFQVDSLSAQQQELLRGEMLRDLKTREDLDLAHAQVCNFGPL